MSENWIVGNLQSALNLWNSKLAEVWSLITVTPESYNPGVWSMVQSISGGLVAIGYALLVLFFAMSIFQSTASFRDFQRPEFALRHLIRFLCAKIAVGYSMDIMTTVFAISGGIVQTMLDTIGSMAITSIELPQDIIDAIEGMGFLASIPLMLLTLLGGLFITVISFIVILTVLGRFFKLYMYTAISPLPLASFAGEDTSFAGKAFIKSYIGVCLEAMIIVLACFIYSSYLTNAPAADSSLPPVTMAWTYIGEVIFNMLIFLGIVKGADKIIKEMFAL